MKTFLNILWILGLLVWSACFAFGFSLGGENSLVTSIITFVAVVALMGVDLFLLLKWVNPESGVNRANAALKEKVALVIFALVIIFTCSGVARFITFETSVRSEVRPMAQSNIEELRTVFSRNEAAGSYSNYVSTLSETYRDELAKNYSDKGTVDAQVAKFEDELEGKSYQMLQNKVLNFCDKCEYNVYNWFPWSVVDNLKELDENLPEWEYEVEKMSKNSEYVVKTGEYYSCNSEANTDLAAKVTDFGSWFSVLSSILILLLVFMMIFPWLKTKDFGQSGPKKYDDGVNIRKYMK